MWRLSEIRQSSHDESGWQGPGSDLVGTMLCIVFWYAVPRE